MTSENKALAPTNVNNEVDRIARAAAKGGGNRLMKFKKGEFFVGSNNVPLGQKFIAYCGDWRRGWRRWENNEVIEDRVGRVADETSDPPDRDDLDCQDKTYWKRSPTNGEPEDPWQFENQLPLEDAETHKSFLFVSAALGGKIGVSILCTRWAREMQRTNGHCGLPQVELAVSKFDTSNYKGTLRPDFRVVGWEADTAKSGGMIDVTPPSGVWNPADDEILELRG